MLSSPATLPSEPSPPTFFASPPGSPWDFLSLLTAAVNESTYRTIPSSTALSIADAWVPAVRATHRSIARPSDSIATGKAADISPAAASTSSQRRTSNLARSSASALPSSSPYRSRTASKGASAARSAWAARSGPVASATDLAAVENPSPAARCAAMNQSRRCDAMRSENSFLVASLSLTHAVAISSSHSRGNALRQKETSRRSRVATFSQYPGSHSANLCASLVVV
mmetsp:Transcript_15402/g.60221  ORF Transcript_15402/g.60221 Transcript_15402/m.60221 type:complete len:227 (+) Transcript_15402:982-1662(+)